MLNPCSSFLDAEYFSDYLCFTNFTIKFNQIFCVPLGKIVLLTYTFCSPLNHIIYWNYSIMTLRWPGNIFLSCCTRFFLFPLLLQNYYFALSKQPPSAKLSVWLNCVCCQNYLFVFLTFFLLPSPSSTQSSFPFRQQCPLFWSHWPPSALASLYPVFHLTPYFTAELRLISPQSLNSALYTAGARLITHN